MKHYGIDNQYLLSAESVTTLPGWDTKYKRSFIFAEDVATMYYGANTGWVAISTSALAGYIHTQSSASATWNINHNLDQNYVAVTIYDNTGEVVMPDTIVNVDEDNTTVTFSEAVAGTAVVSTGNPGSLLLASQKTTYDKASGMLDHEWKGTALIGRAGEAISRGNLCYCRLNGGVWKYYKYDCSGTYKLILPTVIATEDISSGSDGIFLGIGGEMRDDTWGLSGTADATTTVYASTSGGLTMTAPSTSGYEVIVAGFLVGGSIMHLHPGYTWVEVK